MSAAPRGAGNRIFLRFAGIGALALAMAVPLFMVESRVNERGNRYNEVLWDIASVWGRQQTLQGPLLVVPYLEVYTTAETVKAPDGGERIVSKTTYGRQQAVLLPESLSISVDLADEVRHRGIYDSLVYTADLKLTGRFGALDVSTLSDHLHEVEWDKAFLAVGLSDTRAIGEISSFTWGDAKAELAPGTSLPGLLASGFHAPLSGVGPEVESQSFSLKMLVKGSSGFRFAPFGKTTDVDIRSPWPHPSFQGSPTTRNVHDAGFEASWHVPHLTRNYPQQFTVGRGHQDLSEYLAGVDLFEPVTLYDKVGRATKYGLLFVCLTFLIFLIFELTLKARLHFLQYGLVGVALSLFYLTLLALAEHVDFIWAYAAASVAIIGMITLYTAAAMRSLRSGALIGTLLTALYGVLYVILRMEDYALLAGTGLLLLATGAVMFATRDVQNEDAPPRGSLRPVMDASNVAASAARPRRRRA